MFWLFGVEPTTENYHKIFKIPFLCIVAQKATMCPGPTFVTPLRRFSFRLQTACHAFQQSSQLFSTYFPAIFHHAYAAYAMCTVDAVVPPGPVRLDRSPHRRGRCRLEIHLGARLSSSSDSRRHAMKCHEMP